MRPMAPVDKLQHVGTIRPRHVRAALGKPAPERYIGTVREVHR